MAAVDFYHLTRSRPERALARLLGRTLASGERALVRAPDHRTARALDDALWQEPEPDWLPHGLAPERADGRTAGEARTTGPDGRHDPHLHPVWIVGADATDAGAPNGAGFLFLVGGADWPHLDRFRRVFDLFDGGAPDAVEAARARWKRARDAGHTLAYWRETARGWEKA